MTGFFGMALSFGVLSWPAGLAGHMDQTVQVSMITALAFLWSRM